MPAVRMGMMDVGVFAIMRVSVLHVRVPVVGHFVQMAVEEDEPDQDDEQSGGYAQLGIEDFRQDVA